MIAKIQIKFGKAMKEDGEGSNVEYDILARRGSGEWKLVGEAEAHMAVSYDGNWVSPDQYRIAAIQAYLFADTDTTFEVEVGGLSRRNVWTQTVTVAEAKKTIKAWAAEQLSNSLEQS